MRLRFLCPALALALFASLASAQTTPCAVLSPEDLAQLTGLRTTPLTHLTSRPGESTCVFSYPNAPAPEVHDDTDENGQQSQRQGHQPGASLVVSLFRFPTVTAAQAKLAQRGEVTSSEVFTDSPVDTDQVGDLERLEVAGGNEYLVLQGATARHGTTVAIIGFSDGFGDSASVVQLQTLALTLAGAHVIPTQPVDVCARIPGPLLQTLVSLHASSISVTGRPVKQAVSSCEWSVQAEDLSQPSTLTLTLQSFLTSAEAFKAMNKTVNLTPIPHTADPEDKAVSHRDASPGVVAVHANQLATFTISEATPDARNAPGYNYRLERTALLAAGATFPPDPAAPAIPQPHPFTQRESFARSTSQAWQNLGWLTLPFGVFAYLILSWYRRRQLRLYGLPGTAHVDAMSDTGITINNSPRVRIDVTITTANGERYQAHTRTQVSRLNPGGLVGQTVNVRIDPKNPQRFLIV